MHSRKGLTFEGRPYGKRKIFLESFLLVVIFDTWGAPSPSLSSPLACRPQSWDVFFSSLHLSSQLPSYRPSWYFYLLLLKPTMATQRVLDPIRWGMSPADKRTLVHFRLNEKDCALSILFDPSMDVSSSLRPMFFEANGRHTP